MTWVSRPRGDGLRSATIIRTGVIVQDAEVLSVVAIRRLCQSGSGQEWVRDFMAWYNEEHRHSRIRFVTPNERHRVTIKPCWRNGMLPGRPEHNTQRGGVARSRDWTPIGAGC